MHHAKNRGNKEIPLAILSRILAQSCVTLCLNYVGIRRVTHDCVSILDSIAKGISLFPRFFAWCIPTSILNDFCTCSTYFSWFVYKRSYAHAYMYGGREGQFRVARYHLRRRCDGAATSLRQRCDVAPTSLRQTRDPLAKSLRRRRDVVAACTALCIYIGVYNNNWREPT